MKKFLPFIFLALGVLVLAGVYFFVVKPSRSNTDEEDESSLIDVSLNDRPATSLTPSEDGHWLKLKIDKIVIAAESLDYELLYKVEDGRTQGVPGSIKLEGQKSIERDLLLGSESSGRFRYDEGVEEGTLTLRFRNEKGKLLAKFSTDFRLRAASSNEFTSSDGKFTWKLVCKAPGFEGFVVIMETFGFPEGLGDKEVILGPYGLFASSTIPECGQVSIDNQKLYLWESQNWKEIEKDTRVGTNIFVVGVK